MNTDRVDEAQFGYREESAMQQVTRNIIEGKSHDEEQRCRTHGRPSGGHCEHFRWLSCEESQTLPDEARAEVELEIGDVTIGLLNLADKLHIDVKEAARKKLRINEERYPVSRARGSAKKWTERE